MYSPMSQTHKTSFHLQNTNKSAPLQWFNPCLLAIQSVLVYILLKNTKPFFSSFSLSIYNCFNPQLAFAFYYMGGQFLNEIQPLLCIFGLCFVVNKSK